MTPSLAPSHVLGTDIDPRAVRITTENLKRHGLEGNTTIVESNLLDGLSEEQKKNMETAFACLPQVRLDGDLSEGDAISHHYNISLVDGSKYTLDKSLDNIGLGLIELFVAQMTKQAPQAELIVNLAERPGEQNLKQIFANHGRECSITRILICPQHTDTDFSNLLAAEEEGADIVFYGDPEGKTRITAREAKEKQILAKESGLAVIPGAYHGISVARATALEAPTLLAA